MTLTEYMTQEHPVKMPRVDLSELDYEVHLSIKVGQDILTAIEIPALWKRFKTSPYYVQKNDEENLYTQDENGNPKSRSCFYIKDS